MAVKRYKRADAHLFTRNLWKISVASFFFGVSTGFMGVEGPEEADDDGVPSVVV